MISKVYSASNHRKGLWSLLSEMVRDLKSSRDLSWRLAVRDTRSLYRQSVLGILWAFFTPLMNTLVWVFLNSTGVVKMADSGIPYPVFVFTGTMLWSVLLESLTSPLQQTQAAQSMLTKINFPKEALILSGIYKILFNSGIKIALILAAVMLFGVFPDEGILLFPIAVLSLVLFGTAAGLFITPIGMLYTDIGKVIPILMQFLMYFSPVVYMTPQGGKLATLIQWNPITPLITTARNWLTGLPVDDLNYFIIINITMLVVLLVGWILYRISIPIIVERMSS
jgi:lipopolysaccharide transport system permease protein